MTLPKTASLVVAGLVAAAAMAPPEPALAGGLYLPTRGVRPTARGGAFVAGADDLHSLWFNPAGLANLGGGESDKHALLDVGFVSQDVTYERIDSGFNERDPVENESSGIAIPTLGLAVDLGDDVVVAGGIYAPYASLGRYAEDGAQRYSLVDLSDTLIAITQVSVGYRATDSLRIGIGLQNMVSSVVSTLVVNGCPGQTICAPEDPEFDTVNQIQQRDYFSPSGVVGIQYDALERLRFGASFQLPFRVSGAGELSVRLPTSGFFADATVEGDEATLDFTLPPIARFGVEFDVTERVAVEVGATLEFWSVHDTLAAKPENVRIENTPGVGSFEIGVLDVAREFEDTVSVNLGIEAQPVASLPLTVSAGYAYETGAAPDEYLTVMTVDGSKHLFAGGAGYKFGRLGTFVSAAFVRVEDRSVSPDVGVSPQLTPIREDPDVGEATPTFVNWGDYQSSWLMIGAGVTADF